MSSVSENKINYYHNIMGFVPSLIAEHFLTKGKRNFPEKQSIKTVVMFADISGFTNLSETLQKRGNEGSELLAFVLNRYMELLIKSIGRSGGDIFKFAGDAMIVLWPPPKSEGEQLKKDLLTLLRQAVQSGLDIKNKLNNRVMFEKISLSVKIGFGIGDVTIMHVGGVFQRAEYLPAGDPLNQAFECEHHATEGGQVIVSKQIWEMINEYFNGVMIIENGSHVSQNSPFYLLSNIKSSQSAVQMKADALLIKTKFNQGSIQAILPILETYIPKALLPYIKIDEEKWSSELRRLSVMFMNLGIDLSVAKTEDGLTRIQQIIRTVQLCLYQSEGSLNKILMDDKGSTLIVLFGLPPLAHQDDAVRAILAGFQLIENLSNLNCPCSIGITTGLVFTGVVGTSGNRREYSALGDIVNLSARLMQAACGEKIKKILVDEETKSDAEHKLDFKFFECRTVKGKTGQIPMYEPIKQNENKEVKENEYIEIFELRTHCFNTPSESFMVEQYKDSLFIVRREKELMICQVMIEEFVKDQKNRIIFIKGEYGIGKTLFVRCLLQKFKDNLKLTKNKNVNEEIITLITNFHCLQQKKKINGWRKFLLTVFQIFKSRFPNKTMKEIICELTEVENFTMIEEALDLNLEAKLKKEIIIEKEYIEYDTLQTWKDLIEGVVNKLTEGNYPPCILVFDDLQNFDEESWIIMMNILKKKQKKIFFIFVSRNSNLESGIKVDVFTKYMSNIQILIKNQEETGLAMRFFFKGIKIIDTLQLLKKLLSIDTVPSNLLYLIHLKSKGNPLLIIHLIKTMIRSDLLKKNMNDIIISDDLNKMMLINEFITMNVPLSAIKINSSLIDKLECKEILILKMASVIGDVFSLATLKKINIFNEHGISNEELENILIQLELKEIIGILEENEKNIVYQYSKLFMREFLYQRMTYSQRREIHKIYAEFSQNFNEYNFNYRDKYFEKIQIEKLMLHWKLAEESSRIEKPKSSDKNILNLDNETNMVGFSSIAKRSVIVQKISYLITCKSMNSLSSLKQGLLNFKFTNDIFWRKKLFILNIKEIKIYDSENDYEEKPDKCYGCISLKQIFDLVFLNEKSFSSKFAFLLRAGSFLKDSENDIGMSQIYISCENSEILEEWATYIEFARAKAVYDDFVIKFGKISFPLQNDKKNIKKTIKSNQTKLIPRKTKFESVNSGSNLNKSQLSLKDIGAIQTKHHALKDLISNFFNFCYLFTFSTIIQNSYPNKKEKILIGKRNKFNQLFPEFFNIKKGIIDDIEQTPKGLNEKQNSKENMFSFLVNKKKSVSIDSKLIINRYKESDEIDSDSENENISDNEISSQIEISLPHDKNIYKNSYFNKTENSYIINNKEIKDGNIFTFNSSKSFESKSNIDLNDKNFFVNMKSSNPRISIEKVKKNSLLPTPKINLKLMKIKEEKEIPEEFIVEKFNNNINIKWNKFKKFKFFGDCYDDIIPFYVISEKNDIQNYEIKIIVKNKFSKKNYNNNFTNHTTYEMTYYDDHKINKSKAKVIKKKNSNSNLYKYKYGITKENIYSLNNKNFNIPKGELVTIREILDSQVLCEWNGKNGLFNSNSITLIQKS